MKELLSHAEIKPLSRRRPGPGMANETSVIGKESEGSRSTPSWTSIAGAMLATVNSCLSLFKDDRPRLVLLSFTSKAVIVNERAMDEKIPESDRAIVLVFGPSPLAASAGECRGHRAITAPTGGAAGAWPARRLRADVRASHRWLDGYKIHNACYCGGGSGTLWKHNATLGCSGRAAARRRSASLPGRPLP